MRISQVGILNGFLGTIILHLLIGIIFFSAKISGMYSQIVQVQVETPTTIHEEEVEKEKQQHKKMSVDQMADAFIASHNRRNIGVNVSDKSSPVSDKEIQQANEDIDAANKQIADIQKNLDNQDKIIQSQTDEGQPVASPKKSKKIQGKLAVYKGHEPIFITIYLTGAI